MNTASYLYKRSLLNLSTTDIQINFLWGTVLCTIVLCSAVPLFHIQCSLLEEPKASCPKSLPSDCNNQRSLQTWPNILWRQNHFQLRTTDLKKSFSLHHHPNSPEELLRKKREIQGEKEQVGKEGRRKRERKIDE